MNEITRRAANALVATVDFFSGALAAESQAGEEKQKQLDALAAQLKEQIKADEKAFLVVEDQLDALRKEREDLLQKCKNLRGDCNELRGEMMREKPIEEDRKILTVLQHVKRLLTVFPRKSKGPLATFSGIIDDLERAMKELDGIKLEP